MSQVRPTPQLRAVALIWFLGSIAGSLFAQSSVVTFDSVRTQIQPEVEIFIPSGVVRQDSTIPLGVRSVGVRSIFNLYTGAVRAGVRVARTEGAILPSTEVGLALDSNALVTPDLSGSFLVAESALIGRRRFIDPQLSLPLENSRLWVSSLIEETVRLSFDGSNQTRRIDWYPELGWRFAQLSRILPGVSPDLAGGSGETYLTLRVDAAEWGLVDLRSTTRAAVAYLPRERLRVEHTVFAETPLVIVDGAVSVQTDLGGQGGVRGSLPGARSGRAVLVVASTVERTIAGEITTPEDGELPRVQAHSFRLLGALDAGLYQPRRPLLATLPSAITSLGAGLAFTVSAPGDVHFDVRALVAVPITENPAPVFYLTTALFAISGGG